MRIALVGPDGAGKTTVARRVVDSLDGAAEYLYLGDNPAAATVVLPTRRLVAWWRELRGAPPPETGPPDAPAVLYAGTRSRWGRLWREPRSLLRAAHQVLDETYRLAVVRRAERRGVVVIVDRDFFIDYYAHDVRPIPGRSLGRRLHGAWLRRLYPRPEFVILLDADPRVLLERKGEGTLEALARRRSDYRSALAELPRSAIVDASRPLDEVARDVTRLVHTLAARSGRRAAGG